MSELVKTLVVCSNYERNRILATVLDLCGLAPVFCFSLEMARDCLARETIHLVFSEDRLSEGDFRDVLVAIGHFQPGVPLIVFSALGIWDYRLEVKDSGAFDCVTFPFLPRDVRGIISAAIESRIV